MATVIERETLAYSWAEIQREYRTLIGTSAPDAKSMYPSEYAERMRTNEGGFFGAESRQVMRWLREGYDPPKSDLDPSAVPIDLGGEGAAWRWSDDDDGEYAHDEFISGESEYYLTRRPVQGKPGVSVQVDLSFNCHTDTGGGPSVISQYGDWVGSVVRALQGRGHDVSVCVYDVCRAQYPHAAKQTETRVQIKRFGETMIARDFAILFTRPGFRHLIFTASMLEDIRGRRTVSAGLGIPVAGDWGVEFDPHSRVLNITCYPRAPQSFPREYMDNLLREVADNL